MTKTIRIVGALVGLVVAVPVILLVVFFATFDANAVKKQVTQQLSASIGREVAVEGPVSLGFGNGIALTLKDVRIGNPQGFAEEEFVKAGSFDLALGIQALMQRRIDIQRLRLDDASIQLITTASGQNNWEIKMPVADEQPSGARQEQGKEAAKETPSGFSIEQVDLAAIEINNAIIRRIDAKNAKPTTLVLDKASIVPPRDGALKISIKGKLNEAPLDANLEVEKGWSVLAARQPTPVEARINLGGSSYTLKALFEEKDNTFALKNMQANINGIDATGGISVRTSGARPFISGNIDVKEINLSALPGASASSSGPVRVQTLAAAGTAMAMPVAASSPPDLSFLKSADADLDLTCARLVLGPGRTLEKIKTKANLNGGVLQMAPLTAEFLGVPYQGSIQVNASRAAPTTHVVLRGQNVDFEKLGEAFGGKAPLKAQGDISADLSGEGLEGGAFLKTLNGRIEMTAGKGGIDLGDGGTAAVNLMRLLFPKTPPGGQQNLNCAAMRFNVRNGVLNGDGILFDSPIAAVAGEGRVDLVQNSADLVLRHAIKEEQAGALLNVPVRASGPLNSLSFMPEEKAVIEKAQQMLMGGGEVSTGVPNVDMSVTNTNPCIAALNNPKPIMVRQQKPQEAAKELVKGATDTYKGAAEAIKSGKPEDVMNNLKGMFGR